jgi:hypothetical protein
LTAHTTQKPWRHIVDALCGVDRPASILTWKLSPKV